MFRHSIDFSFKRVIAIKNIPTFAQSELYIYQLIFKTYLLKIDQYIIQLLFEHDCVIVPQFGGFVGNYSPAKVDEIKNKFTPPSKEISFNKNLTHNDGLLANHIAQKENRTYQDANAIIKKDIDNIDIALKKGERVKVRQIGTLFYDTHQNIQFEPDISTNYLIGSFGLNTFYFHRIERETVEEKLEKKFLKKPKTEFKDIPPVPPKKQSIRIRRKKYLIAALTAIPFILYLIWLPLKTDIFKEGTFSYSDFNPFTDKKCPTYQLRHFTSIVMTEILKDENQRKLLHASNDVSIIHLSYIDKTKSEYAEHNDITVRLKEKIIPPPISTYVATTKPQITYKYHIVGGCFKYHNNAKRLVRKLHKQGFQDATIVGKYRGLYRVSYQGFTSRKNAVKALSRIRTNHLSTAWLLAR